MCLRAGCWLALVSGPHTELRPKRRVKQCRMVRVVPHNGQHMSGLDVAGYHLLLIARLYLVNESPIPCRLHVEVVTESAVGEWVDHVRESHKKLEMKMS